MCIFYVYKKETMVIQRLLYCKVLNIRGGGGGVKFHFICDFLLEHKFNTQRNIVN